MTNNEKAELRAKVQEQAALLDKIYAQPETKAPQERAAEEWEAIRDDWNKRLRRSRNGWMKIHNVQMQKLFDALGARKERES